MTKTRRSTRQAGPKRGADRFSSVYLGKLIDEATVDCYNESEEITGIFTLLEEKLVLPFTTNLLGIKVTVERIEMNDADEIVAICRLGRKRQRVPVLDLPLPEPRPKGAEWIEAYRRWARRG
jgi:Calcium binding